eukprot:m.187944 g.187944  ORF g.187944 m.187944 type:complete len:717 (-) comp16935_c0_seq17:1558-3708(-)
MRSRHPQRKPGGMGNASSTPESRQIKPLCVACNRNLSYKNGFKPGNVYICVCKLRFQCVPCNKCGCINTWRHPGKVYRQFQQSTCIKCKHMFQHVACPKCNWNIYYNVKETGAYKIGETLSCPNAKCRWQGRGFKCGHCASAKNLPLDAAVQPGQIVKCHACQRNSQRTYCPQCAAPHLWRQCDRIEGKEVKCYSCHQEHVLINCGHCNHPKYMPPSEYQPGMIYACGDCDKTFQQAACSACGTSHVWLNSDYVYGQAFQCLNLQCGMQMVINMGDGVVAVGAGSDPNHPTRQQVQVASKQADYPVAAVPTINLKPLKLAVLTEVENPEVEEDEDAADDVTIVLVPPHSEEYKAVADEFSSSTELKILRVEKVVNDGMRQLYEAKRDVVAAMNGGNANELQLFHGTKADIVPAINYNGFRRDYAGTNAALFGSGVYFARHASYSTHPTYSPSDPRGERRVYLARVTVGHFGLGTADLKSPPPRSSKNKHKLCDSVVDNADLPTMFVIFHDSQALPEYIVVFTDSTTCSTCKQPYLPGPCGACLQCGIPDYLLDRHPNIDDRTGAKGDAIACDTEVPSLQDPDTGVAPGLRRLSRAQEEDVDEPSAVEGQELSVAAAGPAESLQKDPQSAVIPEMADSVDKIEDKPQPGLWLWQGDSELEFVDYSPELQRYLTQCKDVNKPCYFQSGPDKAQYYMDFERMEQVSIRTGRKRSVKCLH